MRAVTYLFSLFLALLFLHGSISGLASVPIEKSSNAFSPAQAKGSACALEKVREHIEYGHLSFPRDLPVLKDDGHQLRPLVVIDLPAFVYSQAPPELIAGWHFYRHDAVKARDPTCC